VGRLYVLSYWYVQTWKIHYFNIMALNSQFSMAIHIMAGLGYAPAPRER
jgi:hypothetical protein